MDGKRKFVIIDLFCGAGGTSFGFNSAEVNGEQIAEVLPCVFKLRGSEKRQHGSHGFSFATHSITIAKARQSNQSSHPP